MKFSTYLKACRIYFIIQIIFATVMIFVVPFALKVFLNIDFSGNKNLNAAKYLFAFYQIFGRILQLIKVLLLSLTALFITMHFKTLYSELKKLCKK